MFQFAEELFKGIALSGLVWKEELPFTQIRCSDLLQKWKDRPVPSYKNRAGVSLEPASWQCMWCIPYAVTAVAEVPPVTEPRRLPHVWRCMGSIVSSWGWCFIGKRKSYIKRRAPILQLAGKVCGELSTLVLLNKHNFMRTDFARHLTSNCTTGWEIKEEFKWA